MNNFVFISPAYNAEDTVEQMLMSIFLQTYSKYKILIRDDMSTDGTLDKIADVCDRSGVPFFIDQYSDRKLYRKPEDAKVIVWKNVEKFWEVKNVLSMIRSKYVKEDDIICRIDCDDFLYNLCALEDINLTYNESGADCLWTAHRWSGNWSKNISGPIPGCYISRGYGVPLVKTEGIKDIYSWSKRNWSTSHLKTFRKYLITGVSDENFRGKDGDYIKRAGDRAIYYPVIHRATKPVFLPIQTYYYTIDDRPETYASSDARFQLEESDFLSDRGFIE